MSDHCKYKMKSGKRKGRPCLEDAYRTADGSHAAETGDPAVFCHEHSPPLPPPMLDGVVAKLNMALAEYAKVLSAAPDEALEKAVRLWRGPINEHLEEIRQRVNIESDKAIDGQDMRHGVRVKGSQDQLWAAIAMGNGEATA